MDFDDDNQEKKPESKQKGADSTKAKRKSEEQKPNSTSYFDKQENEDAQNTKRRRFTEEEDEDSDNNNLLRFTLTEKKRRQIKKYDADEVIYHVNFTSECNGISLRQVHEGIYNLFSRIIDEATKNLNPYDLIRIVILSGVLNNPISICLTPVAEITPEKIIAEVEKVAQSGKDIKLDSSLKIDIVTIRRPRGAGRTTITNLSESLISKKAIIEINNKDELCCARAIVVALSYINNDEKKAHIRRGDRPLQKKLALELHEKAKVKPGSCGLLEIEMFAQFLDVQIIVVEAESLNRVIHRGLERERKVYIYKTGDHYHTIRSMTALRGTSYYCLPCDFGYKTLTTHRCEKICHTCFNDNCVVGSKIKCPDCNKLCKSTKCFDRHKETGKKQKSFCDRIKLCKDCYKIYKNNLPHVCGQTICKNCKENCNIIEHRCFIKRKEKLPNHHEKYIFFDIEADQTSGEHIANFIVMRYFNGSEKIFSGYNCLDAFGGFLFSRAHKGYTVIAHNMQGYDGMFLINYLIRQTVTPKVIMRGSKLLCITVQSLRISVIDSLSFFAMGLSKLPKSFGLEEMKKGYFPHLFNTRDNQQYVGPMPLPEMFSPNQMGSEERVKFMTWYECHKDDTFNFQKEILGYCSSDVDILRRCCLKFREEFIATNGMDPFTFITIASACMGVYNGLHLKENTLAVIPPQGYVNNVNSSEIAAQWIAYLEKKTGKCIQSSQRGRGEIKILQYHVDGYQPDEKKIYEFHGCFYHGCDKCFEDSSIHPFEKRPMWAVKRETLKKEKELKQAGYDVESIWEHEFLNMKKEDKDLQEFLSTFKTRSRLNPRDSFYGGRTDTSKLYHKVEGQEKIKYIDFTSLYPYVNKYCLYPVGHPEIIRENFTSIENYFGLVHCQILPPRRLFHPVLPVKSNGKLIFGLCASCIATENQDVCDHSETERYLKGTWTTLELTKALEVGYEMIEMLEVYHFKEKSSDLFRSYIDTFLKIKQEASGWPKGCNTEEEKLKYVEDYYTAEGIRLDPTKIEVNQGMRSLSKLMLNSFWGKFGQDLDKLQTVFVSSLSEFNSYFTDKKNEIQNVSFPTDNIALMQYKVKKEFLGTNYMTNIFIAIFTTSHARLKLLNELEKIGEKVLYCDTDSIIYVSDGLNDPPTGNYLGDFTDELSGDYITEFVSAGPKNYAYRTSSGKTVCKIRGFTLNYENSQILNFSSLKDIVTHNKKNTLSTVNPRKICRNLKDSKVINKREKKNYKFNFDKRVVQNDFKTYPYGYLF